MNNLETLEIAKKNNLRIILNNTKFEIKHEFKLRHKSTLGVLAFSCIGIFFILFPSLENMGIGSKLLCFLMGSFLVIISLFSILRQLTDKIEITNKSIEAVYNFKRHYSLITKDYKCHMKSEYIEIRRVGTIGTDYIYFSYFLNIQGEVLPIFKFKTYSSNNDIKFGKVIESLINAQLASSVRNSPK